VRFITEKPWPGLIDRISLGDMLMMPPKALKTEGAQGLLAKPIGTGPFKFAQWVRDEKLVVVRNDDYWKGKPELKKVTFRFIPEFSARLAALLAGEIDIMKDVPPHAVDLVDKSGKAVVRATVSSRINYLALVTLKPGPMQDIRVRQAIAHAVNVDELIQSVLRGRASKMCGPLSPINVDFSPKVQCVKYDVAHAKNLLKAANIDPGKLTLTLDTPSGRYPLDKDISQAIAAQLGRIGITVNVVVNEWGTHLDKIKNRTTGDMFFLGWGPAFDAQGTIEQLFQASQTYSSYGGNKLLEDKIATAITIVDTKKRLEAWAEIQQIVANEAPWAFLWQQHDLYGVANWLDWQPRADEKVWMYEAKLAKR
jgi:peptide/nickel transport system substrate-binding protein